MCMCFGNACNISKPAVNVSCIYGIRDNGLLWFTYNIDFIHFDDLYILTITFFLCCMLFVIFSSMLG